MADASRKVVLGKSDSDNVSTFVNAVKVQINTSQKPVDEFAKFMMILQSQPVLENLFRQLLEEYSELIMSTVVSYVVCLPLKITQISLSGLHM